MNLTDFILEHEAGDTAALLLSRTRWPEIDMEKAVTAIECRKRLRSKLPEWYTVPGIEYPDRLAAEQCSSSENAGWRILPEAWEWTVPHSQKFANQYFTMKCPQPVQQRLKRTSNFSAGTMSKSSTIPPARIPPSGTN